MASNASYRLQKKRYTQISVKKRKLLVQMVIDEGKTLSDVGRKLHINPSTVRLIIKRYRETGTYFMKRLRNTPKQSKSAQESQQSEEREVKVEREDLEVGFKVQQGQKQEVKQEEKVKIQQPKSMALDYYYPFLQHGFPSAP